MNKDFKTEAVGKITESVILLIFVIIAFITQSIEVF